MMKISKWRFILIMITVVGFTNQLYSQVTPSRNLCYEIIKYFQKENPRFANEPERQNICGCTYPFLIRSHFVSVIGKNLQDLKKINSDSLSNVLERMDNYANASYEKQFVKYLAPKTENCSFIISFSRKWNDVIYVETIPFDKTYPQGDIFKYVNNYMGIVNSYMFKFAGGKIVDVKSGTYYIQ